MSNEWIETPDGHIRIAHISSIGKPRALTAFETAQMNRSPQDKVHQISIGLNNGQVEFIYLPKEQALDLYGKLVFALGIVS